MNSLEDIIGKSESTGEIVVSYMDAMELLYIYENNNTKALGWEGWIKHLDGGLGHSKKYQGTTDLTNMSNSSAIALIKSTIMQAHTEWEEKPEVDRAELMFCITIDE